MTLRYLAITIITFSSGVSLQFAGPFAPAALEPGSTAIAFDDSRVAGWVTAVAELVRGPVDITVPTGAVTTFGSASDLIGPAGAFGSEFDPVVSLGDGGHATVTFAHSLRDLPGPDLAVFENSFNGSFLELAFVEVSSNGVDFFRFPAESLTPTGSQVGGFGSLDPTNLYNLAGKYEAGFGTPFDLAELHGVSTLLDVNAVTHVRIVDVIGTIAVADATFDSMNRKVNDPYPTNFPTGGFDLDGVAVLFPFSESYNDWAGRNFTAAEASQSGFDIDFEQDGLINGLEAAFLRDPRSNDPGEILEVMRSGDGITFSFVRVPWMPEFTYALEVGSTLGSWDVVAISENGGETVNVDAEDVEEMPVAGGIKVYVTLDEVGNFFGRVRVSR
ncbi:MAG: hypothetical protein AAGJ79_13875 [Verrucomicrobiota bacterium]